MEQSINPLQSREAIPAMANKVSIKKQGKPVSMEDAIENEKQDEFDNFNLQHEIKSATDKADQLLQALNIQPPRSFPLSNPTTPKPRTTTTKTKISSTTPITKPTTKPRTSPPKVPAVPAIPEKEEEEEEEKEEKKTCTACTEEHFLSNLTKIPCNHIYCPDCLTQIIQNSLEGTSAFPPRCCGTQGIISIEDIDRKILFNNNNTNKNTLPPPLFPQHLITGYRNKILEFEIPSSERVYCSSKDCSTFVGRRVGSGSGFDDEDENEGLGDGKKKKKKRGFGSGVFKWIKRCVRKIKKEKSPKELGFCYKCGTATCMKCKHEEHCGVCSKDKWAKAEDEKEFRKVVVANRWMICRSCERVLEKESGCNHMRCRCGTEMCYQCGSMWKFCHCQQWPDVIATHLTTEEERMSQD